MSPKVRIDYRRPPDRLQVFEQHLVHETDEVVVTLARKMSLEHPMRIEGHLVLEDGSDVVWFTFPGVWHDIGRFHLADGTFTGIYANVITPVEMDGHRWETTDLFLDVWIGGNGRPVLLDEREFEAAAGKEWMDPQTIARVRQEADSILEAAGKGAWPPPVVAEWTRDRALEVLGGE